MSLFKACRCRGCHRREIADPRGEKLQFTVDDKAVFNMPWAATMTYRSGVGGAMDWNELTCAENIQWDPGRDSDVPRASKPDF
jgi:hypothetical protein